MSVRNYAVAAWFIRTVLRWLPHLDTDCDRWAPVALGTMQTGHQQLYTIQQHGAIQGTQIIHTERGPIKLDTDTWIRDTPFKSTISMAFNASI